MCCGLLKVLVRKLSLVSLRRSTYLFSVALVMVIYFVRFVYFNAGQPGDIHEVTYHYEGVLLNGTRYEMVRVNRSMRRLIEGSSVEAPTQNVREELANTLLSDVGFKYVVRPVRQIKKLEKDPLLSNDHIYYAKKRTGMTDTVGPQKIVNPHPFTYTLNNEKICGPDTGSDVLILMYVHSAPENAVRRNVIRATWGARRFYGHKNIRLIFVLGTASTPAVTNMLMNESSTYDDIVQSSFIDDYRNLTYKAISALRWVSLYCHNAKFVLKSDDDILVNPFTLMTYLAVIDKPVTGLIICKVYERGKVFRAGYRRLVTREEYAGDKYPPFCSGSAHLMTTDVAVALYRTSYSVEFFWPDDVFITGLLPFKLNNITFVQIESRIEVIKTDKEVAAEMTGRNRTRYIFGHIHDTDLFRKTWSNISLIFT